MKLLIQSQINTSETRAAYRYAMLNDVPYRTTTLATLRDPSFPVDPQEVPIGSVEFVREVFRRNGMTEPANFSYPEHLTLFLGRAIHRCTLADLDWNTPQFIKPVETKLFTGFVLGGPGVDTPELSQILTLSKSTEVYTCPTVIDFVSESRFYVQDGKIVGASRYDDGADDAPCANPSRVQDMATLGKELGCMPIAYSLDVGVDARTGNTLLVEANDFWALGLYPEGVTSEAYLNACAARWMELRVLDALDKAPIRPLGAFPDDYGYEGSLTD